MERMYAEKAGPNSNEVWTLKTLGRILMESMDAEKVPFQLNVGFSSEKSISVHTFFRKKFFIASRPLFREILYYWRHGPVFLHGLCSAVLEF
jgi:hypothetical protein